MWSARSRRNKRESKHIYTYIHVICARSSGRALKGRKSIARLYAQGEREKNEGRRKMSLRVKFVVLLCSPYFFRLRVQMKRGGGEKIYHVCPCRSTTPRKKISWGREKIGEWLCLYLRGRGKWEVERWKHLVFNCVCVYVCVYISGGLGSGDRIFWKGGPLMCEMCVRVGMSG